MAPSPDLPSVDRLAGQLRYLFEDHPELRTGAIDALVDRLNHEDRFARAREHYPQATDAEIAQKVEQEFPARITPELVRAAVERVQLNPD
jgi:hypothetical protein